MDSTYAKRQSSPNVQVSPRATVGHFRCLSALLMRSFLSHWDGFVGVLTRVALRAATLARWWKRQGREDVDRETVVYDAGCFSILCDVKVNSIKKRL